jgi:probable addiction module antidote protein
MTDKLKRKSSGNFREYVIDSLKADPELASEYLNAAIEDGDISVFLMALGDLAKARGMSAMSKKTGLNRENIYRIVSTKGNPQIKSVFALLNAMDLKLKTEPAAKARKNVKRPQTTSG